MGISLLGRWIQMVPWSFLTWQPSLISKVQKTDLVSKTIDDSWEITTKIDLFFFNFKNYFCCVCLCALLGKCGHMPRCKCSCTTVCMWKSEDNLQKLFFSSIVWVPGIELTCNAWWQVPLSAKSLCWLAPNHF